MAQTSLAASSARRSSGDLDQHFRHACGRAEPQRHADDFGDVGGLNHLLAAKARAAGHRGVDESGADGERTDARLDRWRLAAWPKLSQSRHGTPAGVLAGGHARVPPLTASRHRSPDAAGPAASSASRCPPSRSADRSGSRRAFTRRSGLRPMASVSVPMASAEASARAWAHARL